MKIIVINAKSDFSPSQQELLSSLGDLHFIESKPDYTDKIFSDNEEKVIALGPEVVEWKFPNEIIDKIHNLKAICLPTTSFSWVDGADLKTKGIVLTNVPKYSTESVAEYAIWMMLSIARKIPLIIKNDWKLDYSKHAGNDLKGKTIGIIGLGSIGTRIAELGSAMGMEVIYWSKNSRNEKFKSVDLDTLLKSADFIFPTLAKNSDTANIIDESKLKLLKSDAVIISTTGKDICDIDFAIKQVEANALGGVAFESEEKTMVDYKGNVLVAPPVAWFTKESVAEDMRIWVESIQASVSGQPINLVN